MTIQRIVDVHRPSTHRPSRSEGNVKRNRAARQKRMDLKSREGAAPDCLTLRPILLYAYNLPSSLRARRTCTPRAKRNDEESWTCIARQPILMPPLWGGSGPNNVWPAPDQKYEIEPYSRCTKRQVMRVEKLYVTKPHILYIIGKI